MTSLYDLRERVRAATGPDRELDGEICIALGGEHNSMWRRPGEAGWYGGPADVTASVDACLALLEKVLPGWVCALGLSHVDFRSHMDKPFSADVMGPVSWRVIDRDVGEEPVFASHGAYAETLPLAFLDAILTAKIEEEGQ
jgi:hypothetical protein